jgi:DNA-binding transcriptional ArsR family regulator
MSAKSKQTARPAAAPVGAKRPQLTSVPATRPSADGGPVDRDDATFDRLVYERVRLGIMSALAVRDELSFAELKALFDVSDGNLSAHARKLEEANYLSCTKTFEFRRPKTLYRLTALGKNALNRYLDHVEAVIKATRRT